MPEKQATQSKSGQKLTDISPKKTYIWLINTWKAAQYHSLLEKCKSKLQWIPVADSFWYLAKLIQLCKA